MGVFAIDNSASTAVAKDEFVASDEIVIGHLTDVHYFPISYGHTGEGTDFANRVASSPKLTAESHLYVISAFDLIVEKAPDYLVVSGDLTTDGEIQAHVEVANLLRQTQNRIRANGNEDFQIFVIFGNHDLYNEEAFDYSQDGSARLLPNATRYDMTKVYSSLGYPDLTDEEIATMASLAYVRFTLNTNDEFYVKEMDFYNEAEPVFTGLKTIFADAMLKSPHREYLETEPVLIMNPGSRMSYGIIEIDNDGNVTAKICG